MRRWGQVLRIAAAVLAIGVAALGGWRAEVVRAQAPPADDPALLRELAERLLGGSGSGSVGFFAGPGVELPAPRAQLFPGALPPDLPYELPLPPESRLVGSAVTDRFGRSFSFQIVLDAPGSEREVAEFFSSALKADGWIDAPSVFGGLLTLGGFVGPELERALMGLPAERLADGEFCQGEGGRSLSVHSFRGSSGMRDVRITGETSRGGLCSRGPLEDQSIDILPILRLPPDTRSLGSNSGGFSVRASRTEIRTSEVTVGSAMSVIDLEAEFARQLGDVGWTRRDGGTEQLLAWSTWAAPAPDDREGFLSVMAEPGSNVRVLRFQARRVGTTP